MSERPIDTVLSRLGHVRENGSDRWMARCPAHDDKNPSLSIREADDGKVLIYCFAGCAVVEIVDAIALDMQDLFPDKRLEPRRWQQTGPPIPARDVVEILQHELTVVSIAASLAGKCELPAEECSRLCRAAARIREGISYAIER